MKAPFLAALGALLLVGVVRKKEGHDWTPPQARGEVEKERGQEAVPAELGDGTADDHEGELTRRTER